MQATIQHLLMGSKVLARMTMTISLGELFAASGGEWFLVDDRARSIPSGESPTLQLEAKLARNDPCRTLFWRCSKKVLGA